jgi:hypothetical protein
MTIYEMAREHYERLLRQQVESDVPDHAPPVDQVAEPETRGWPGCPRGNGRRLSSKRHGLYETP